MSKCSDKKKTENVFMCGCNGKKSNVSLHLSGSFLIEPLYKTVHYLILRIVKSSSYLYHVQGLYLIYFNKLFAIQGRFFCGCFLILFCVFLMMRWHTDRNVPQIRIENHIIFLMSRFYFKVENIF